MSKPDDDEDCWGGIISAFAVKFGFNRSEITTETKKALNVTRPMNLRRLTRTIRISRTSTDSSSTVYTGWFVVSVACATLFMYGYIVPHVAVSNLALT